MADEPSGTKPFAVDPVLFKLSGRVAQTGAVIPADCYVLRFRPFDPGVTVHSVPVSSKNI